ncbi:MAG: hypothetical protein WC376_00200 [Candidatus Nanoarchaeia archaeon]|jgi:hypothetical protein
MLEFYLLNITKNNSPFFIYHKEGLVPSNKVDFMQCEFEGINCVINSITGSSFNSIILENGYLVQKKRNYLNKGNVYELSFIEGYFSKNTNLNELSIAKRKLSIHMKKFDELFKESIFELLAPNEKFKEFGQYLLGQ